MDHMPIVTSARMISAASVVGKKEKEGPLGGCFDLFDPTDRFGAPSWEMAESEMQRMALNLALKRAELTRGEIDALFAGDLLNQCVGSAYGLLPFAIPYFGIYGACSTSAQGLILASMAVSGGGLERACVVTSSHYCSAERQFRTPVEYGGQRAPTAQWTVTGAAAFAVARGEAGVLISRVMPGRICDAGISDVSNMGAAMAPAALDTLLRFFRATGEEPTDFDLIVTGDLGFEGGAILRELAEAEGYSMTDRHTDCGMLIYDQKRQDVHSGGSGCGCSATVLASHFLPKLQRGELRRILFLATGALMSPDSLKQGASIPGVAHLVELKGGMG